jgi:hypothetical protein
MYADLDPTRSELLDMLAGTLIGIENFSGMPMAEQGVLVLLRRRREREAEARGKDLRDDDE